MCIYKPPKQVRCMLYLSVHTCWLLLMVVDCKGNLDGCVYDGTRAYKIIIKAYPNYIQPTTALYYYIRDSPDRLHAYLHHPPLRFAQFLSLLIVAPKVKIIIYTCVKLYLYTEEDMAMQRIMIITRLVILPNIKSTC